MKKMSVMCKVITPMFNGPSKSYGDPNKLEIRPSSIKGMMRFWWRAVRCYTDLNIMKDDEDNLFGSTDRKSPFSIQVEIIDKIIEQISFTPHHRSGYTECTNCKENNCKKSEKYYAFCNTRFSLTFLCRDANRVNMEQLFSLLELCAVLGGVGRRSRRGFGSFSIQQKDNQKYQFDYSLDSLCVLLNKVCGQNYYECKNGKIINKSKCAAKYPWIKKVEIGKQYLDFTSLLQTIGESSHKYNQNGLLDKGGKKRLASPVYVSAIEKNNQLYPIITSLNSKTNDDIRKQQAKFKEMILCPVKNCGLEN